MVAHAIAKAQDALGRHGIEEARSEAAEATIAETRVNLLGNEFIEVDAHVGETVLDQVADAIVEQVVIEQGAKQELEAEVVDLLLVALLVLGIRGGELDVRLHRDELGQGLVLLKRGAVLEVLAHEGLEHVSILGGKNLGILEDTVGHVRAPIDLTLLWCCWAPINQACLDWRLLAGAC